MKSWFQCVRTPWIRGFSPFGETAAAPHRPNRRIYPNRRTRPGRIRPGGCTRPGCPAAPGRGPASGAKLAT